jgi:hypothetical protein
MAGGKYDHRSGVIASRLLSHALPILARTRPADAARAALVRLPALTLAVEAGRRKMTTTAENCRLAAETATLLTATPSVPRH